MNQANKTGGRKTRPRGVLWMALGLCCLFASLCLTLYNVYDDARAGSLSEAAVEELDEQRNARLRAQKAALSGTQTHMDGVMQNEAGISDEDGSQEDANAESFIPDYKLNPDIPMPETVLSGNAYIGTLELPALGLRLPVMSSWSYPNLRKSPCRYTGSTYQNNLIIAGHNYRRHFSGLKRMKAGEAVIFTDEAGNVFRYTVEKMERMDGYAVEQMQSGDWDLTLFTCTDGGRVRLALRCGLAE